MKFTQLVCATTIALTSFSALADDDALSILALKNANFSAQQAIEKVSNDYTGSIVEFELDDHKGQTSYEIEIINLKTEEKHKLQISSEDGSLLKEKVGSTKLMGINRLDEDEIDAINALSNSQFNLQSTVAILREKYSAEIVEFELENKKGITFYKFKLIDENGRQRVIVDVKSGEIIPVLKK